MSQISVLLADDNGPIRDMLANALRQHFRLYEPVANGRQLVEAALVRKPDVVVTDVWMPVLSGLEALQVLRELGRATPFVMVSADADIGPACLAAGAAAFVCKANIEQHLVAAVAAAVDGAGHDVAAPVSNVPRDPSIVSAPRPHAGRHRPEREA